MSQVLEPCDGGRDYLSGSPVVVVVSVTIFPSLVKYLSVVVPSGRTTVVDARPSG